MKSEKVWKALLLTFSSLLIAFPAKATELVEFRDYDANTGTFTNAVRECTLVTAETRTLESGWYAVKEDVVFASDTHLTVEGDAHLILCDGATLAITNLSGFVAAVDVSVRDGARNSLTIYGQVSGTGTLLAKASGYGAGIGGGKDCDGGAVTINGGIVEATGGMGAAGIGCGYPSATNCAVTINGGTVTATGGMSAAGIGGGYNLPWNGTVTITGGRVTAKGDGNASAIGPGEGGSGEGGTIAISGGLFWDKPDVAWIATDCVAVLNRDEATKEKYPWKVGIPTCTVTIGEHPNLTVAWTSGGGSVTNAVEGTDFEVPEGTEDVKVVFTPELTYDLVGDAVVNLGKVTKDVVFGEESGYKVPKAEWNGSIAFRDYDANTGMFTDAARKCTLVTSATRTLENGWYAVQGTVTIPEGANLTVVGTAHLILCDGARLSVENPAAGQPAVNTEGATLVIYGQTAGTGALVATGGGIDYEGHGGAGIGGGKRGAGGIVTINGGTVTAMGGGDGAGIGGGYEGAGGAVTVNGGTVTATGGKDGAGIGGGKRGAGGTVTINGGIVTATGGEYSAGIGGGAEISGGTVTITGGIVTATGGDKGAGIGGGRSGASGTVTITGGAVIAQGQKGGEDIGHGYEGSDSGTIRIVGGIFWKKPNDGWLYHAKPEDNLDPETSATYPYAVVGTDIPYLDWDPASKKMVNAVVKAIDWIEVTEATRALENGGWYVVTNHIVFPQGEHLHVNGSARLILCDGASLTIPKADDNSAGVIVTGDASLVIYGQTGGTGALMATGGEYGAGVGGDKWGECGIVTINGGMVTAMGGNFSAGIGGGDHGTGGAVTINGGTVTATGGSGGAGIGGGNVGSGGSVTINGGAVTAVGNFVSDIGLGFGGSGGTVTIFGGVFARPIKGEWTAEGYAVGGNSDSATSADYPYAVMSAVFTVTIGDHPHSTVQWTYGDGAVTSLVTGTSFKLGTGMTGVCVIFTPEHGYCFTLEGETGVRPLPSPVVEDSAVEAPAVEEIPCEVTFAVGAGIRRAAYVCGGVTNELVTEETALVVQLGTRVELIVEELPRYYPFAGERTFTVEQETMRVEIFASPIPKGMEGNPFQIGEEVFAYTNTEGVLTITGTGAMSDFASSADVPWVPAAVTAVTVGAGVTQIGANAWSGMEDSVAINGTALSTVRYLAPGVGTSQPSGAISGADFETVQIVDGKAYLGVSIATNSDITAAIDGWGTAKLDPAAVEQAEDGKGLVIPVPATSEKGFMILRSKPAK